MQKKRKSPNLWKNQIHGDGTEETESNSLETGAPEAPGASEAPEAPEASGASEAPGVSEEIKTI